MTLQTAIPALTLLGGGPAGLAVAHYAQAARVPFSLYERADETGGLCRTLRCGAHRYDTGAHRLHDRDPEITRDLAALLGDELVRVSAPSQILYRGKLLDFPPSPLGWLRSRGPGEAARTALELLRARLLPRPERTFEDRALNRYGRTLAGPLLLDYSEKLWGLPARELAPEVATRRLAGLSVASLFFELLGRKASHLDGQFYYPRSGYGAIAERLAASLPADSVHTGHEVNALECSGGNIRALGFAASPSQPPAALGRVPVEGRVVSTLPLPLLARLLGDALPASAHAAAAQLRFRHVRLVFLRLSVARCSRNATLYLPDPKLCVSRVTEPKNRSAAMSPAHETSLVAEVPCSTGEPLASLPEAELVRRVIGELAGAGLLDPATVLEWRAHFLPNAYPVYARGFDRQVSILRAALSRIGNLDLLGRSGLFWYSHLHDQLKLAKEYVTSRAQHAEAHPQVGEQAEPGPA